MSDAPMTDSLWPVHYGCGGRWFDVRAILGGVHQLMQCEKCSATTRNPEPGNSFTTWLAAHDAEVRVKALEEAAAALAEKARDAATRHAGADQNQDVDTETVLRLFQQMKQWCAAEELIRALSAAPSGGKP